MTHPFEISVAAVQRRLDEMVDVTFADLQSHFLTMARGPGFVDYGDFQDAYECLKRHTDSFSVLTEDAVWAALREDALALVVLRTMLGFSPPEWAELARTERGSNIHQGAARSLDTSARKNRALFAKERVTTVRARALVSVAVEHLTRGALTVPAGVVHRLDKVDTRGGLASIEHAAAYHVPYAVLLYERFLGRPFASHRDSISGLVGDIMEDSVEDQLTRRRITFRRTKRAERIPGFEQAADFYVPTEQAPTTIIEAKITSDDGTARDKVARIRRLAEMRDARERKGRPSFELVACVDGRGFGVRRNDMRDLLTLTRGKVFTLASLDRLVEHTGIARFVPKPGKGT